MIVRELVTKLGFSADTAAANRYEGAIRNIRRVATRTALAVGAIGTATTALVGQFANASAETLTWARRLGISTDELQRLQFAAGQYRITNEALIDGLKEASLRADEFVQTGAGPASEAFERLGLSAGDLRPVLDDTGALFETIRARVAEVDNIAARQRIVDELFGGQAGEQFAEFMAISRDRLQALQEQAAKLGVIIPEETLEGAVEFTQESNKLGAALKGISNTVAAALLPAYQEIVGALVDWFNANSRVLRQGITRFVERLSAALEVLVDIVNEAVDVIGGWGASLRLAFSILTAMVAIKAGTWAFGMARAFRAAALGAGILRGALSLLARTPLLLAFTTLVVLIEDLIVWMLGGRSLIGRFIGDFDDFREKIRRTKDRIRPHLNVMKRQMSGLGDIIAGTFTFDSEQILRGMRDLFEPMYNAGLELGRRLRNGIVNGLGGFLADLFLGKEVADAELPTGEAERAAQILSEARRILEGMSQREREERKRELRIQIEQDGIESMFPVQRAMAQELGLVNDAQILRSTMTPQGTTGATGQSEAAGSAGAAGTAGIAGQPGAVGQDGRAGLNSAPAATNRPISLRPIRVRDIGFQNEILQSANAMRELVQPRGESINQSSSVNRNVNVNANTQVKLDVPPGTSEEQRASIERQAEEVFSQQWDRLIRGSMWDFQPVE